jgi:arsenate reductase
LSDIRHFDKYRNMETKQAVIALSALSHETRLLVFRLLVRQGPEGLPAGQIAEQLNVAPPTMSAHLAQLERAGLVRSQRLDRRIFYALDVEGTRRVLRYLTEDCCQGQPDICGDLLAATSVCAQETGRIIVSKAYNVLFVCTGNSARSIMAECALNRHGAGKFKAFSAGSHPKGEIHPLVIELLRKFNYVTEGLRSKDWQEFAGPGAPDLDFVFTVCDSAAGEVCPAWPGQPMTAHWGVEDPVAFDGPDDKQRTKFRDIYFQLERRIQIFTNLPIRSLDKLTLQKRLDSIGKDDASAGTAA